MSLLQKGIGIVLSLAVCSIMGVRVMAFSASSSTLYNGIDISSWQGAVDFSQVKNAGIDVVYIKASEGTNFTEPYFETNYAGAKANGMKIGFYHYVTARQISTAQSEAEFFWSLIQDKEIDCRLAMDFESFGSLSQAEINSIGLAFLERLEQLSGMEMVVYSNLSTARDIFDAHIAQYPLWIAEYGVPEPKDPGTWQQWIGFQYSSTAMVPGISGTVDTNKFTAEIFLASPSSGDKTITQKDAENKGGAVITVRQGDTLSKIAAAYNTTVTALAQLNHIPNVNIIYTGQKLEIPQTTQHGENKGLTTYTITQGDTLTKIAWQFNTTVSAIAQLNNIKNIHLIYAGQTLQIPVV